MRASFLVRWLFGNGTSGTMPPLALDVTSDAGARGLAKARPVA
jgi:hypothetical protein